MDKIDQKLVTALRRDGRAAVSQLSADIGVTRATVRARMDRLAARGDIVGYSVVMRDDVADHPVRALMMIGISGRGTDQILRRLSGLPAVQSVHSTNGKWDLVVDLVSQTLVDLDAVLAQIRRFDGVQTSETSLLLTTRRPLPPKPA